MRTNNARRYTPEREGGGRRGSDVGAGPKLGAGGSVGEALSQCLADSTTHDTFRVQREKGPRWNFSEWRGGKFLNYSVPGLLAEGERQRRRRRAAAEADESLRNAAALLVVVLHLRLYNNQPPTNNLQPLRGLWIFWKNPAHTPADLLPILFTPPPSSWITANAPCQSESTRFVKNRASLPHSNPPSPIHSNRHTTKKCGTETTKKCGTQIIFFRSWIHHTIPTDSCVSG